MKIEDKPVEEVTMKVEAALEGLGEFVGQTMAAWKVPGPAVGIVKRDA